MTLLCFKIPLPNYPLDEIYGPFWTFVLVNTFSIMNSVAWRPAFSLFVLQVGSLLGARSVSPLSRLSRKPHQNAPPTQINSEKCLSMFCLPNWNAVFVWVSVIVFLTRWVPTIKNESLNILGKSDINRSHTKSLLKDINQIIYKYIQIYCWKHALSRLKIHPILFYISASPSQPSLGPWSFEYAYLLLAQFLYRQLGCIIKSERENVS